MTLPARPGNANPVIHASGPRGHRTAESIHEHRTAVVHNLGRAYGLARHLTEVLELEAESDRDVALIAEDAKRLRRTIADLLARKG